VTGSSAKPSSAFKREEGVNRPVLGERDLHLWVCSREVINTSDTFKRTVLSRYTGRSPDTLRFTEGEHGKPRLSEPDCDLQFNLSHSGDWLACAVTSGTPVGVDLEFYNQDRASMRVARRYFREEEFAALEECEGGLLAERFYDFWTLKEAAVKARGEALAPGLSAHAFSLDFSGDGPREAGRITVMPAGVTDTAHYLLLDPLPDYRLALCWLGSAHISPRLGIYELRDGGDIAQVEPLVRASNIPQ